MEAQQLHEIQVDAATAVAGLKLNPGQVRAHKILLNPQYRYILLYGGSRSGKTAYFISTMIDRALSTPNSQHLIARKTGNSALKAVVHGTFPKIWALKFPLIPVPKFHGKDYYYKLPNGAKIWIAGMNNADVRERILGAEFSTIFMNEANECTFSDFEILKSRLNSNMYRCIKLMKGKKVLLKGKFFADCNPDHDKGWVAKTFLEKVKASDDRPLRDATEYTYLQVNPIDNVENNEPGYLETLQDLSDAKYKRFGLGEFSGDDEKALWKREWFKYPDGGWEYGDPYPVNMQRIVIGVDPAMTSEAGSDETGIVVVGLGGDGNGYVLADESGRYRMEEWADIVLELYKDFGADEICAEINAGGEMVENIIFAGWDGKGHKPHYRGVRAIKNKQTRAEPIAEMYRRGKIIHLDQFNPLMDQMLRMTPDFDPKESGYSPDRLDACVWACTSLFNMINQPHRNANRKPQSFSKRIIKC